ncbi:oligopeptide transporter 7 [Selaginella moellendorffii]|uniref:oligopeptide transporter 7 n=1 Tax=Selaginella moellendorffii TaxID=88036 RepID=UPI000D1CF379|nr:oligopeptide transporter 7 [Selaginella moellendorffii]XP_024538120.1 oligopeptide transporter 7 [Selaginella moellendorffii]|eukprot:XP_024538119.1 oligopeptide transporter 7 [Selaginella moellendorffii]
MAAAGPGSDIPRDDDPAAARDDDRKNGDKLSEEEQSPIEEVALTVPTTDDASLPVYTFRMWTLGLLSCALLAFINQFFSYRTEPLTVGVISAQIAALPLGRLMAAALPSAQLRLLGRSFSLNPGPFNVKEHVLITIFANAGAGGAYAIGIVNIVKAFYGRELSFVVALLITLTTQITGYGWAGIFRRYLVDPAEMWWPSNLVQVSIFNTLHEKDSRRKGDVTRLQFFLITLACSFLYYSLPGYLFKTLTSISWVCWAWPKSVLAHQLGSGMSGMGIGAVGFDWSTVASYLSSPLATPWFAIANVMVGFLIVMYVITPAAYFSNVYSAKTFPIFSSQLFADDGSRYNISRVVNERFELDVQAYNSYSKLNLSTFFVFTYGVGFAALTATVSHVVLFHGKEMWSRAVAAFHAEKLDVHTRLMRKYKPCPQWWFLALLALSIFGSIITCVVFKDQVQLPWWGVLLACGLAFVFTLPIGVITATTNQTPGLNVITEFIIGYMYPGRPVANVCFKTYGYISMLQAITFLADFKLGHYMKIPPRSMFTVQIIGTVVAALVNLGTAWWLLTSVDNICHTDKLPQGSPWTCPSDRVFFSASVIWGLIGPNRIFGSLGHYQAINWFFLVGAVAPLLVWLAAKAFPRQRWIRYVNMPILIGATGNMPPATSVNYTSWFVVGFIFNYLIFKHRKQWWTRYNYVLSAAMDAGLAFMGIFLYFATREDRIELAWWGQDVDNCPLASCPAAKGARSSDCPLSAS